MGERGSSFCFDSFDLELGFSSNSSSDVVTDHSNEEIVFFDVFMQNEEEIFLIQNRSNNTLRNSKTDEGMSFMATQAHIHQQDGKKTWDYAVSYNSSRVGVHSENRIRLFSFCIVSFMSVVFLLSLLTCSYLQFSDSSCGRLNFFSIRDYTQFSPVPKKKSWKLGIWNSKSR
eukprot:GDKJ01056071.1.p1 GENE.GDKJ01056071.1~~GDKJ01056071.1.p1  ORF type:complete len:172 (+),score=20.02 GDKJ01056071.1:14-529(+)